MNSKKLLSAPSEANGLGRLKQLFLGCHGLATRQADIRVNPLISCCGGTGSSCLYDRVLISLTSARLSFRRSPSLSATK